MAALDLGRGGPPSAVYGLGAFVDVETTGFSPARDEVIELGIVLFGFNRVSGEMIRVIDEYSGLQQPSRPIPPEATAVNGITDAQVRGQALNHSRVCGLLMPADVLIAHNASFDRGFLLRLYPRIASKTWACSVGDIDWRRSAVASRRLQDLLAVHGLKPDAAHRALADCRSAVRLLAHSGPDGRTYLQQLLRRRGLLADPDADAAGR